MIVICVDEKIMVRHEGKIEETLCMDAGWIYHVIALPMFRIFDTQITIKLMYICGTLCVESLYQKSVKTRRQPKRGVN